MKERVRVRLDYLRHQFAESAPPTIQLTAGEECPLNRWFFSVEQCPARSSSQPQTWTFASLILSRLQ